MDRMSERLAKHGERIGMVERRASEAKDKQVIMYTLQKQMDKLLQVLQVKTEDLKACLQRNNVRIVGIAESTNIDNMERYIE
ncbi:hypothetical protein NDU88_001414 [Pleurodeles waltl]|uniref:Uncharacterized protein n=1 Tax=Pleurodeles waltl TaxID=8319 RepID=A0AAV7WI91_PLEWA|nr:hypothetical protein NDU88_001414 [Pleurodeles waltl]